MHTPDTTPLDRAQQSTRLGWLLVAAQGALLVASAASRPGTAWPRPAAFRVAATGLQVAGLTIAGSAAISLRRGLTALPYPNVHAKLRTDGLFARVRHPIYAGLLLAVSARAAGSGRRAQVAVAGALLGLFEVKARVEEDALRHRFTDYDRYAECTGRLLPRLRRSGAQPGSVRTARPCLQRSGSRCQKWTASGWRK